MCQTTHYSNECDKIYIDTYPGQPGSTQTSGILAHEIQHIMNFAVTRAIRFNGVSLNEMDLWIDEGLSTAAEWVWSGTHSLDRVDWYNKDPFGTIVKGNNFFVWGNHFSQNSAIVLDDYSTVYLFFQWLRLQAGGASIYKKIVYSPFFDYKAVTNAANTSIPGKGYGEWPVLLKTWLAANYINAPSGPYGYMNDSTLKHVQGRVLSGSPPTQFQLAPGEGIYTKNENFPDGNTPVKYTGLPSRGSTAAPNDKSASGSSALLSYNTDTNTKGPLAGCYPFGSIVTDFSPEIDTRMDQVSSSLTLQQLILLSGPYTISAKDMLRFNGYEDRLSGFDFSSKFYEQKGITAGE
jgi:hypothetical protein